MEDQTITAPDTVTNDDKSEMKEVRKGRTLHCRQTTLRSAPESSSSVEKENNINILFIHGSCASSQQYNALLKEMNSILCQTKDDSNLSPTNTTMNCFLYDQLGCGKSKHSPKDWGAYSAQELLSDLIQITRSILEEKSDENLAGKPLYLISHSHGVSQTIRMLNTLTDEESSRVKGVIFIAGGLKGGPSSLTKDGGHWIFTYLPMFMLKKMQPSLSKQFVQAAILNKDLHEAALGNSNQNDMEMCKAFYRQQKYATAEDAQNMKCSNVLVIHGKEDMVLPLSAGEHLVESLANPKSKMIVIPNASHQVFEEKASEVASYIMDFIMKSV